MESWMLVTKLINYGKKKFQISFLLLTLGILSILAWCLLRLVFSSPFNGLWWGMICFFQPVFFNLWPLYDCKQNRRSESTIPLFAFEQSCLKGIQIQLVQNRCLWDFLVPSPLACHPFLKQEKKSWRTHTTLVTFKQTFRSGKGTLTT